MRSRDRLAVMAVATVLSACGGEQPSTDPAADRVLVGVCQAQTADEFDAAETAFGRVHGPLHDLAAGVGELDRQVAGRLHRAKAAVEQAAKLQDANAFDAGLRELESAVRASLDVLQRPAPACPEVTS